jgi:hypothetical protein
MRRPRGWSRPIIGPETTNESHRGLAKIKTAIEQLSSESALSSRRSMARHGESVQWRIGTMTKWDQRMKP